MGGGRRGCGLDEEFSSSLSYGITDDIADDYDSNNRRPWAQE